MRLGSSLMSERPAAAAMPIRPRTHLDRFFHLDDPACLNDYAARERTRLEHAWEIRDACGFEDFAARQDELRAWLQAQVRTTTAGPKARSSTARCPGCAAARCSSGASRPRPGWTPHPVGGREVLTPVVPMDESLPASVLGQSVHHGVAAAWRFQGPTATVRSHLKWRVRCPLNSGSPVHLGKNSECSSRLNWRFPDPSRLACSARSWIRRYQSVNSSIPVCSLAAVRYERGTGPNVFGGHPHVGSVRNRVRATVSGNRMSSKRRNVKALPGPGTSRRAARSLHRKTLGKPRSRTLPLFMMWRALRYQNRMWGRVPMSLRNCRWALTTSGSSRDRGVPSTSTCRGARRRGGSRRCAAR